MRTEREAGTALVPLSSSPDTAAPRPGYVLRRFVPPVSERQQRVGCRHRTTKAQRPLMGWSGHPSSTLFACQMH